MKGDQACGRAIHQALVRLFRPPWRAELQRRGPRHLPLPGFHVVGVLPAQGLRVEPAVTTNGGRNDLWTTLYEHLLAVIERELFVCRGRHRHLAELINSRRYRDSGTARRSASWCECTELVALRIGEHVPVHVAVRYT